MLLKTHLIIALTFILYLVNSVNYKILFVFGVLIATILPDVDSTQSFLGRRWYLRPFQWVTKHRGMFHSLSFCFVLALLISFFYPLLAFPFFLGYGVHLLADSMTIEGIRPFWPNKNIVHGNITTGGRKEKIIFYVFIILDVLLFIGLFI